MSFKKLLPEVAQALGAAGIVGVSEFGARVFSAIKSGSHLLAIAPKKSGKTTVAVVATFSKVNKELDGSPRVIYICSSVESAGKMHELMTSIANPLDVTVDLAHDKGDMVKQRNDIFNGTEIIVGTMKRVFDLYVQNGINIKLLDYCIIDDFEEVLAQGKAMEIKRFIDGFGKTQLICLANERTARIEHFAESVAIDLKELNG